MKAENQFSVKGASMRKNYLLFMPSLISRNNPPRIAYRSDEIDEVYYGFQTNVPASMLVLSKLAHRGEQLNGIIMLCSKEVLNNSVHINGKVITTYDHYAETISERMREFGYNDEDIHSAFVKFPLNEINPGSWSSMDTVQNEMLSLISGDDNAAADEMTLFVDYTGGLRSASMLLVFFSKLLESQGVKVEDVFYSNISKVDSKTGLGEGKIESCMDTYRVFDYLSAFTAESLDKLDQVFSFDDNEDFRKLIKQTIEAKKKNQRGKYTEITESDRETVSITDKMDILHRIAAKKVNEVRSSLTAENEIRNLAKVNDTERAIQRIKEHGLDMLIEKGIITWNSISYKSSEQVKNAFYAYVRYYRSYLDFAREMLLNLDLSKEPADLWDDYINFTEERYMLIPSPRPKGSVAPAFENEFNKRYSDVVYEMKSNLVKSIRENANNADRIIQIVDEYNNKRKCFISAYLNGGKGGFPFANILNGRTYSRLGYDIWYDEEYKDSLDNRMRIVCGLSTNERESIRGVVARNGISSLASAFPPIMHDKLFTVREDFASLFGVIVLLMDSIRMGRNRFQHEGEKVTDGVERSMNQFVFDFLHWLETSESVR